jgi:hypothetical protein
LEQVDRDINEASLNYEDLQWWEKPPPQDMTTDQQEDWYRSFDAKRKAEFMRSLQPGLGGVGDGGDSQRENKRRHSSQTATTPSVVGASTTANERLQDVVKAMNAFNP